jgi:bifunctional ADP-heptose synthase (sugar kinase/adenylyltransferase)/phosphoglycolate phosphatase-like HAD superfamily hydrolase
MDSLFPTPQEIAQLMQNMRSARIGVLGDFCLDAYFEIDSSLEEISVETGKRVQHVRRQRYSPGGAGNVVVNLNALGVGHLEVFGAVGDDLFGREMARQFVALGAGTQGLLVQTEGWDTPVYGKPLLDGVEQQRLDFGAWNVLSDETWVLLQAAIVDARSRLDFLIVNQQLPKGWCIQARAAWMCDELRAHWQAKHLVDARHFVRGFKGVSLKLNQHETANLLLPNGQEAPLSKTYDDDEALAMARQLVELSHGISFVTRGECGVIACQPGSAVAVPGIQINGPTDTVGAGDAATAMLSACLSTGADAVRAATMANLAASITVQKLNQTGTASEPELIAAAKKLAYVYHPTLADEPRRAHYVEAGDIEIIEPWDTTSATPYSVGVFDHDGTLSTLRQGWETVMEPVMMHAILGAQYQTADSGLFHIIQQRVQAYIEQSTGIQTIAQMDGLVQMVAEFNIVPASQRLDAWGYKAIYNQALMEMVNDRLARLARGELAPEDFSMKGIVHFLHALHEKGMKLYLVSGTDEADTLHEASLLGYADLFNGGIHGAKPGSRADTKDQIIREVIESLGGRERFMVFGDGPVEIRLGRRYGGLACGIASNEERRFGVNLVKRRRLIRAGANLLTPDFSQWPRLVATLFGE